MRRPGRTRLGEAGARRPPAWSCAALLGLSLGAVLGGCGRSMTLSDCERVGKHMREVWDSDAGPTKDDRAKLVIKTEGDRMQEQWLAECKREIEGRKIDENEISCILGAKTIAAIQACAAH